MSRKGSYFASGPVFISEGDEAGPLFGSGAEAGEEVFEASFSTQHCSFSAQSIKAPSASYSLGAHASLHFPPNWVTQFSLAKAKEGSKTMISSHLM